MAHPKTEDQVRNLLFKWVVKPETKLDLDSSIFNRLNAAISVSTETDAKVAVQKINEFNLPREVVNTALLNDKKVWEALLQKMPMTALVRNLAKMTSIGLLAPMSDATNKVVETLSNAEHLAKSRIHPIALLSALRVYAQGHGERGNLTWTPVQQIVDALDKAFYLAFKNLTPTGKRIMLALDVSGSMGGGEIAGIPGLTPRDASGAMALITAAVEKNHLITGFTAGNSPTRWGANYGAGISPLNVSPRMRLDTVLQNISGIPFGGTDCSLPMVWALKSKTPFDAFVVYTDNETWAGNIQPVQALTQYRSQMGIDAKLIVVAMTPTNFTIADPNDRGMLDVAGFDTATPQVMSDFIGVNTKD